MPVFNRTLPLLPIRLVNENEVKQWRDQAEKFRKGEELCLNLLHTPHTPFAAQPRTHLLWRGAHADSHSLSPFPLLPHIIQNTQNW